MEEVDEREIFEGAENSMTMNQTYTHEFRCLYDLEKYPFDRQVCSIDMTTTNLDAPTMRLVPNHLWVEQNPDMTLFYMDRWDFAYKDKKTLGKGITMMIFLKRKVTSEMLCQRSHDRSFKSTSHIYLLILLTNQNIWLL